jgi:hypothetical protein
MDKKLLIPAMLLVAAFLVAPVMAKTTSLTVNLNQAQFQWRGSVDFGDWSYSYLTFATSSDYTLTGNVLHTEWSYSPPVTDVHGQSTVYVYDKSAEVWIEHEGQVSYVYVAGYGDTPVANFFRGYLDFGGNAPSDATFVHGVAYQWIYLYLPSTATLTGSYTQHAVWDEKVNAWLVGFSIYLWDRTPQAYNIPFPNPFIEPVPANNYNPLGL